MHHLVRKAYERVSASVANAASRESFVGVAPTDIITLNAAVLGEPLPTPAKGKERALHITRMAAEELLAKADKASQREASRVYLQTSGPTTIEEEPPHD